MPVKSKAASHLTKAFTERSIVPAPEGPLKFNDSRFKTRQDTHQRNRIKSYHIICHLSRDCFYTTYDIYI